MFLDHSAPRRSRHEAPPHEAGGVSVPHLVVEMTQKAGVIHITVLEVGSVAVCCTWGMPVAHHGEQ